MYIYYYMYKMLDPEKSPLPSPMFGIIDIFLNISPSLRHILLEYSFYYSYGRVTGRKKDRRDLVTTWKLTFLSKRCASIGNVVYWKRPSDELMKSIQNFPNSTVCMETFNCRQFTAVINCIQNVLNIKYSNKTKTGKSLFQSQSYIRYASRLIKLTF